MGISTKRWRHRKRAWLATCCLAIGLAIGTPARPDAPAPKIGHVFVIMLENKDYADTFGPASSAPYLAQTLPAQGALLTRFYGIAHFSLPNYIGMISGQAPNPHTQGDCETFTDFTLTGWQDGQAVGHGCVYPASVKTLADQMTAVGLRWRAYLEDMGNNPKRESATCGHPLIDTKDQSQVAEDGDQYAARHNPFVYFHSIIDSPDCAANVVALPALTEDLKTPESTPRYVYIAPNLCHDGHDGGEQGVACVNGEPGGLISTDQFLRQWVPRILASAAFQQDGLLIITFDESEVPDINDARADATACCNEQPGPNVRPRQMVGGAKSKGAGIAGPGGGRIGAVLLSPFIKPGTISSQPYNHYALLKSIEDIFALPALGYAGQKDLRAFGDDIFTRHRVHP